MSSTSASAVWPTTSPSRAQWRLRVRAAAAVAQAREIWRRRANAPGARRTTSAESIAAPSVNSSVIGDMRDVAQARNAGRRRADETRQREVREAERQHTGERGDDDRFGHLQPNELARGRADRAAHREIALASFGAHEEQIGDVGARDEQHDPDGGEQHPERPRDAAEQLVLERTHDRPMLRDQPRVVGRCRRTAPAAVARAR